MKVQCRSSDDSVQVNARRLKLDGLIFFRENLQDSGNREDNTQHDIQSIRDYHPIDEKNDPTEKHDQAKEESLCSRFHNASMLAAQSLSSSKGGLPRAG